MLPYDKVLQGFALIKVKSVTDSLFWYGGIIFFITMGTSWFAPTWISIVGIIFTGLFVLLGFIFYIYFAFKDPKFLRSEVFHQNMTMIESMGSKEKIISIENIEETGSITNPDDNDTED